MKGNLFVEFDQFSQQFIEQLKKDDPNEMLETYSQQFIAELSDLMPYKETA
jgi:hypothetical protein